MTRGRETGGLISGHMRKFTEKNAWGTTCGWVFVHFAHVRAISGRASSGFTTICWPGWADCRFGAR
jgi:hypothetical protein